MSNGQADIAIDGEKLGARLRELRLAAGLTQAELAKQRSLSIAPDAELEAKIAELNSELEDERRARLSLADSKAQLEPLVHGRLVRAACTRHLRPLRPPAQRPAGSPKDASF